MSDYTPTGKPDDGTRYDSRAVRREFELIAQAINSKSNLGSDSTVSTTSMLIESPATKTFTAETGKDFAPGQTVYIARTSNPTANNMTGTLISYDKEGTGQMVVSVTSKTGTGTYSDWTIGVSNQSGVTLVSNTFTGAQNFARATVASHATNSAIWPASGNQINFTGTATVTAFPNAPQAGAERVLICAGACSFVASANLEIDGTPSGGTLVCAVGDIVVVRAISVSATRLSIVRYAGDRGGAATVSSAVNITLQATSPRLQCVNMTTEGRTITLPSALTTPKGASNFVIRNTGVFLFSILTNAGTFLGSIKPFQSAIISCESNGSASGLWRFFSDGGASVLNTVTEAVLVNAVDSRNISIDDLNGTSAICCYKNNATGKIEAVVLNSNGIHGTPLQIGTDSIATGGGTLAVVAQKSDQATVFYIKAGGGSYAYVLDIAGNTITPGTIKEVDGTTPGTSAAVALSRLSDTQLYASYRGSVSITKGVVFTVSSSVIALSASHESMISSQSLLKSVGVTASKVLLVAGLFAASSTLKLQLEGITAGVPAVLGGILDLDFLGNENTFLQFGVQAIGSERALVAQACVNKQCISLTLVDVSGSTPTIVYTDAIQTALSPSSAVSAARLIGNNKVLVSWIGSSGGLDSVVAVMGGDDKLYLSDIVRKADRSGSPDAGYLDSVSINSNQVMSVCRGSSTYLSCKMLGVL